MYIRYIAGLCLLGGRCKSDSVSKYLEFLLSRPQNATSSVCVQYVVVGTSWIVSPVFTFNGKLGKGEILYMIFLSHRNISAAMLLAVFCVFNQRCHNILLVVFLGDWVVTARMGMCILVIVFHCDVI